MLLLVIPLAVLAAFFYSLSDFLEQRAAHRAVHVPDSPDAQVTTLRRLMAKLVRDRTWVVGWAVGTFAYLVQAAALRLGSVTVVQSLQVTTLLFALPLSTIGRPHRMHAREWLGGGAISLGLLGFLLARGAAHSDTAADRGRLLPVVLLLVAVVVLLVLAARAATGASKAVLYALAAGIAFASSATLVKLTSTDLTNLGVVGTARDWPGYSLAIAAAVGMVLQQAAFASGKLPTAATAMVVANPVVGAVVAFFVYREPLPADPARLMALALSAFVIVVGVSVLTHSPLLGRDTEEDLRAEAAEAERLRRADGGNRAHRDLAGPHAASRV